MNARKVVFHSSEKKTFIDARKDCIEQQGDLTRYDTVAPLTYKIDVVTV